ncbi:MAG: hypothetical protein KDD46_00320 [Bdellovibrionales bacterium]|nr:hypothetical protein [Bdellovibrionales bacterium]
MEYRQHTYRLLVLCAIFGVGACQSKGTDQSNASQNTDKPIPGIVKLTHEEPDDTKKKEQCKCGGTLQDVSSEQLQGLTFPLIGITLAPSYLSFSNDPSPRGLFVEGPGVQEIPSDQELEFPDDIQIQTNTSCNIGIYTAFPKEEVRQQLMSCGPDSTSTCNLDPVSQTMVNIKTLLPFTEQPHLNCTWNEEVSQKWNIYALTKEGHFANVSSSKSFGLFTLDTKTLQATLTIDFVIGSEQTLQANDFSVSEPITFEDKDTLTKARISTYSEDGKKITHIAGTLSQDKQTWVIIGIPSAAL